MMCNETDKKLDDEVIDLDEIVLDEDDSSEEKPTEGMKMHCENGVCTFE